VQVVNCVVLLALCDFHGKKKLFDPKKEIFLAEKGKSIFLLNDKLNRFTSSLTNSIGRIIFLCHGQRERGTAQCSPREYASGFSSKEKQCI